MFYIIGIWKKTRCVSLSALSDTLNRGPPEERKGSNGKQNRHVGVFPHVRKKGRHLWVSGRTIDKVSSGYGNGDERTLGDPYPIARPEMMG